MWTTLYILCGVSSWLVWTHGGFEKQRVPLTLYGINMLFNLAWNPTFFLFHAMQTAFWDALGASPARPYHARKTLLPAEGAEEHLPQHVSCIMHSHQASRRDLGRHVTLCIVGLCRLLPR